MILACTFNGGIGFDNNIPWNMPEDLQKFKKITTSITDNDKMNALIMGRNTWESLPKRPLKDRINIIITRDYRFHPRYGNVIVLHSIQSAMMYCFNNNLIENIFVIGGASIYNDFLLNAEYTKLIEKIYLSVMYYDKLHQLNKFIDMQQLFEKFKLIKDKEYQQESDNKLFASFVCIPKSQDHNST